MEERKLPHSVGTTPYPRATRPVTGKAIRGANAVLLSVYGGALTAMPSTVLASWLDPAPSSPPVFRLMSLAGIFIGMIWGWLFGILSSKPKRRSLLPGLAAATLLSIAIPGLLVNEVLWLPTAIIGLVTWLIVGVSVIVLTTLPKSQDRSIA